MAKKRHKNTPASYLILLKDNKILLLRRYCTGYEDGSYSFIAGHVNEGEAFSQCIIREAKEEVGVLIKPEDLRVVHVMHRNRGDGYIETRERVDVFFIAKKWDGEIENREPHKCDDLSWFNINAIPENVVPFIRQAIEMIKGRVFYSEHGWR